MFEDAMITEFFEELKLNNYKEEENLKTQIKSLNLILKENSEFIKLLESEDDSTYEVFSPRKIHPANREKIESLKKENETVREKIYLQQELLDNIKEKQKQLEIVMEEFQTISEKASLYEKEQEQKNSSNDFINEKDNPDIADNFDDGIIKKNSVIDENGSGNHNWMEYLNIDEVNFEITDDNKNLVNALHGLELCSKIIDIDPVRCKMEITSVMENLVKTISRYGNNEVE